MASTSGHGQAGPAWRRGQRGPCHARPDGGSRGTASGQHGPGGNRSGHGGPCGGPMPSRKLRRAGPAPRQPGSGGTASTSGATRASGQHGPAGNRSGPGHGKRAESLSRNRVGRSGQRGGPAGQRAAGARAKARARSGRAQGRPCLARLESSERIDSIPRPRFGPPRGQSGRGLCPRAVRESGVRAAGGPGMRGQRGQPRPAWRGQHGQHGQRAGGQPGQRGAGQGGRSGVRRGSLGSFPRR